MSPASPRGGRDGSARLGAAIAEGLAGAGITEVVVCPGSRSTSVVIALAALADLGRLRLHTRIDERVAGFVALGLAKSTGAAAIVVTSGTAVGNLLPAVMEARLSGVPLVVITADRPATLIGSGSNQTTDQIGIFGHHVVADLHLASTDDNPVAWQAGLGRVLTAALGLRTRTPGPVQVNAAFTEPFLADPQPSAPGYPLQVSASRPAPAQRLEPGPRTVVLAGDAPPEVGWRARQLAEDAGLPLLAEPSSNARAGRCAIRGYRRLLDSELGAQIDRVLLFGHPTLSRSVTRLLSREDVELVAVAHRADWPDPGARVRLVCDAVLVEPSDGAWLDAWLAADAASPQPRATGHLITGVQLAAEVVTSASGNLVFGSSNPIRDADLAPIADQPPVCWANRGLSGIDGVIATATGIALGTHQPTTVLLGDLALRHDLGSLQFPSGQPVPDLRVVVADDDGGSIFRTLEVAGSHRLDELFVMPHRRPLAPVAAGFGWPTHMIGTLGELRARLSQPISGVEVLIVAVDPNRSRAR